MPPEGDGMAADIESWLASLGLSEWAAVFAQNQVDLAAARDLTEADLRELGVPLGPRKRLLRAIAAIDDPASAATAPVDAPPPGRAERRRLTVLFCDLVGSTALAGRLDPEDMRELTRRYQDAVAGVVVRYDGYVAKFLGDGVLAYFGWPQAHENDAERAVRAGTEMVSAVTAIRLEDGDTLRARVGMATGEVVVGDLVSKGGLDAQAVTGETPNLAARLQEVAGPDAVLVDAATRQLIGDAFDLTPLGAQSLKGFAKPVPAWRVGGERAVETRFDAAHAGGLTTFVGRAHEVSLLQDRWQLATGGEGQFALLSGPPGIGKSRILSTLTARVGDVRHFRLRYQCSPYHSNIAFYPVVRQLELAAGFDAADAADAKLDKLERLLELSEQDITPVAPLFAALLSLPFEQRYGALELTPQQLRERTIAALIDQLLALARLRPVLFLMEDAHWIDPSTETLVGETIGQVQDAAVFALITHRPEYTPPWSGHPHLTSVSLSHLSRAQSAEIARAVAGERLDDDVIGRIVERAGGVPLYVEELTKALLEGGDDVAATDIPMTLQASLLSRLDRLDEAKQIAQVGAVIGREFPHALLAAVAGPEAEDLDASLERLIRSELVSRTRAAPEPRYAFKHALIRDAAYDSLLRERRRELHARVAAALLAAHGDDRERAAEIATHLAQSGQAIAAAEAFTTAGDHARQIFANREALEYFSRALELWRAHPDRDEGSAQQLSLGNRLAALQMLIGNYREAERICREILDEAGPQARPKTRARLLSRLARALYMRGENAGARETYRQALELAEKVGDKARLAALYRDLGDVEFTSGTLPDAIAAYSRGGEIAAAIDDAAGLAAAQTMLCNAHARAGDLDMAVEQGALALSLGQDLGDERRVAWACCMLAQCYGMVHGVHELDRMRELLLRAQEICERTGDYRGAAWTLYLEAQAAAAEGDFARAFAIQQEHAARGAQSGGFQHEVTASTVLMARYLMAQGSLDEALDHAQSSVRRTEQTHNLLEGCEAQVVTAQILQQLGGERLAQAQTHADRARDLAEQVGAKRIVGEASLVNARIAAAQGDMAAAKQSAEDALRVFDSCGTAWHAAQARSVLKELDAATG